ncbi:MAG: hypothetical protein WCO23_00035 [bacterium]
MIELELTYLAKYLPENLKAYPVKEIVDIYVPVAFEHPTIRIRKNGDVYEITKKEPVSGTDSSEQLEQTIKITAEEFQEFLKFPGKIVKKHRYIYPFGDLHAEIDVFDGDLSGLILVDFEFDNQKEKDLFVAPDFCLAEITQEKFLAGGMVCGKSYKDIEQELSKYNYKKIIFNK